MNIPTCINRETIQMTLIVVITFAAHYYFITNRLSNYQADEPLNDTNNDEDIVIIEQSTQA